MVTPRDEHVAAVEAYQMERERELTTRIEQAMTDAREKSQSTFSVSLSGFPVGTYEGVLRPYRDAGWKVMFSEFRNESQLNFS